MKKNFNASVLRSIFTRKGGVGEKTILIVDPRQDLLECQRTMLYAEEVALFCYNRTELEWILFTDRSLRVVCNEQVVMIDYKNLKGVEIVLPKYFKRKDLLSQIFMEEHQGKTYLLDFEQGRPLFGIFAVLQYIVGCNYAE